MAKDISFSKAITRLEEIVAKLESQNLDLEEAMELLQEGVLLHKKCKDKLKNAQSKIDKVFEDDKPNER